MHSKTLIIKASLPFNFEKAMIKQKMKLKENIAHICHIFIKMLQILDIILILVYDVWHKVWVKLHELMYLNHCLSILNILCQNN